MLKLMYITNDPQVALIAEKAGVDRIWIDLETLGKEERQKNFDTVKSHHSIDDIRVIAPKLTTAQMLVRIDPWNPDSEQQIDGVIDAGAQIVMLPYWKKASEVRYFIDSVNGRCKTMLLLETKEAVECLEEVLDIPGVDEIHIGLNDLHLSYGLTFMFELYVNGVVEQLAKLIKDKGIPFGIGGMGNFDSGLLPRPEDVIVEHYRLGSQAIILSRSFCNYKSFSDMTELEKVMNNGVAKVRSIENECELLTPVDYKINKDRVDRDTMSVVNEIKMKKQNTK